MTHTLRSKNLLVMAYWTILTNTRPASIDAQEVPAVLQNGDHKAIAQWRRMQALGRTWQRRPDLLSQQTLSNTDQRLLEDFLCQQTREGESR